MIKSKKLRQIAKIVVPILKRNGVVKAGIFGSYARGEEKKRSDVDMLVKFKGSLLDLVRIERELKTVLRKNIDLLTYGSISPYLKEQILKEEVRII